MRHRLPARPIRSGATLLAVVTALLALVLGAGPASAHASLESTTPVSNALLTTAPTEVTLTFSEPVGPAKGGFVIYGPDGFHAALDATGLDNVVTAPLPVLSVQGTYLLDWRVVSIDSHPISGSLVFSVGTAGIVPDRVVTTDDASSQLTARIVQFLAYVSLAVLIGLALFRLLVARTPDPRWWRWTGPAALATVLAHLALVPLTYLRQQGLSLAGISGFGDWVDEFTAGPGVALLLVVVGAAMIRSGRTPMLVLGALAAAVSVTTVGHTRGERSSWWMIASDVVHILAAATWLGGLLALVIALRPRDTDPVERAGLVARFSALAGVTVAALALSGLLMAIAILDDWAALWQTGYGRTLIVKVALAAVVLMAAAWNRFRLVPLVTAPVGSTPDSTDPGVGSAASGSLATRRLRRVVTAELVVVTGVTAVTALLVSLSPVIGEQTPTGNNDPAGQPASTVLQIDIPWGNGRIEGSLRPGTVGLNNMRFTLHDSDGNPVDPSDDPVMTLSDGSQELLLSPRYAGSRGAFGVDVRIPEPGAWTIEFVVPTEDGEVTAQYPLTIG